MPSILVTAVSACVRIAYKGLYVLQMFTPRERSQLDVYGIWSIERNQLHTDDSFTFNKTIKRIKEHIEHLDDAEEADEEALQAIKVSTRLWRCCC